MKVRKFPLLTFVILNIIWITCGCKSYRQKDSLEGVTTLKSVPSPEVVSRNSMARTIENVKMEDIWRIYEEGKHEELIETVDVFLKEGRTDENTKATCYFLKGDCQRQLGKFSEAEIMFQTIIADYNDTEWKDPDVLPSGHVPVRPQVDVGMQLLAGRDRCQFPEDSNNYTALAWKYLEKERYDTTIFFAWECIRRFKTEADEQQKLHVVEYKGILPDLSPDPKNNTRILQRYWALYDVGTCYFIVGQAYEEKADDTSEQGNGQEAQRLYNQAIKQYEVVITKYPATQCFDPRGPWYWSVKQGAIERIDRITDNKLKR